MPGFVTICDECLTTGNGIVYKCAYSSICFKGKNNYHTIIVVICTGHQRMHVYILKRFVNT